MNELKVPLPEQDGWALDMHGAFVSFANNAERAAGFSPGCSTQVFSAAKLLSHREEYAQAQIKPLVEALQGMCDVWRSVCTSQGWEPSHMVQYRQASELLALHSKGA